MPHHDESIQIQELCTPNEWGLLRTRIAEHEARLLDLAPAVRTNAVIDALLQDARTDVALRVVLQRIGRQGAAQRRDRAAQN